MEEPTRDTSAHASFSVPVIMGIITLRGFAALVALFSLQQLAIVILDKGAGRSGNWARSPAFRRCRASRSSPPGRA